MRIGRQTKHTCPVCGASVFEDRNDGSCYCGNEPGCAFSRLSPPYLRYVVLVMEADRLLGTSDESTDPESLDCRDDLIIKWLGLEPVKKSTFDSPGNEVSACQIGG